MSAPTLSKAASNKAVGFLESSVTIMFPSDCVTVIGGELEKGTSVWLLKDAGDVMDLRAMPTAPESHMRSSWNKVTGRPVIKGVEAPKRPSYAVDELRNIQNINGLKNLRCCRERASQGRGQALRSQIRKVEETLDILWL